MWDELGDRITDAVRALRRGQPQLQRELYSVGRHELTPAQVTALELVASAPAWRMYELATGLRVDQSTATRTVAPLVDLELLTRQPDPADRRCVVVAATPSGRRVSRTITERRRGAMREVVGRLAPERRLLLAELLEEYLAASHAWEQEQRARRSA